MPGIVGFVGQLGRAKSESLVPEMARAMKHEEWYQTDLYYDKYIGLGRVSLGIINTEPQPIWNKDRTRLIFFEGEIFDYQDIKKELITLGYQFHTLSDAEFILYMYEEFGRDFVSRLNGSFVTAIWDQSKRELLLANDRFGFRPLYYANYDGHFAFASNVGSLLADDALPRRTDAVALAQMLSFEYVLGDRTLLESVHLLPPASLLSYRAGSVSIDTYWALEFEDSPQLGKEEAYMEELIFRLRKAVQRRLQYPLPTGLMLSGGLDSRMILGLLHETYETERLHTFSYGLRGCDDAKLAQELAALTNTKHHFFELQPDYLLEMGEKGIVLNDGMQSCVHMHALANLNKMSQHAKVIFKGFLGDALMGGHLGRQLWTHQNDETFNRWVFDEISVGFEQSEHRHLFTRGFFRTLDNSLYESVRVAVEQSDATLLANRYNHFDIRQRQRRFILCGVESVRSQAVVVTPFDDNDVVDMMLKVPPGFRLDRKLLVEALIRTYPEMAKVPYEATGLPLVSCRRDLQIRFEQQVRWRLREAGLGWISIPGRRPYADYDVWMRTHLRSWVKELVLSNRTLERGYFKPEYLRNLVSEHMNGQNHSRKLSAVITIECWHRQAID